jgi:hypothetical protein
MAAARWQQRDSCGSGGSKKDRRQLGGGKAVAAAQQRDVGGSLVAALRWRQRQRQWWQRTARRWQRCGSSGCGGLVAKKGILK